MANRIPLVHANGELQELPGSDSLVLAGPAMAAPVGRISIGARSLGGRELASMRGSAWGEEAVQGRLDRLALARWRATGNITTIVAEGAPALTSVGTVTARAVAAASMASRARRVGAVSAATAGSFAGWYLNSLTVAPMWSVGSGAGAGGFFAVFRFSPSDAAVVSGARMFAGMAAGGAAPTNVEPNTLTNAIGVAALSTSANLQIVSAGSTAQTAIDLGSAFPANGLSSDVYELVLAAPPASLDVGWRVERLNTGDIASGALVNVSPGVTLPTAATFLSPRVWRSNNAIALSVGIDLLSLSIEAAV